MKYSELIGKKLVGVMKEDNVNVYLYFDNFCLLLVADNQDYSWYSNWRIAEVLNKYPSRNENYKAIGRTITRIDSDYSLDTDDIRADMNKWIEKVGEGSYGAKDGKPYTLFTIVTTEKELEFGTTYCDCHYQSTWMIEYSEKGLKE